MARIDGKIGFHPSAKAGRKIVKLTSDPSLSPRAREAVRVVPASGSSFGDPSPADQIASPPWSAGEAN